MHRAVSHGKQYGITRGEVDLSGYIPLLGYPDRVPKIPKSRDFAKEIIVLLDKAKSHF